MLKSEFKQKVTLALKRLISQKTPYTPSQVNLNWIIGKDIQLDSIDMIEIEMELEDMYDISFADTDLDKFNTLSELIDLVINKKFSK